MILPLIITVGATVFFAALETVVRYLRDRQIMTWSQRPALVGAIFWAVALIIFQRYRTTIDMPTSVLHGVVGGVVWYFVAVTLGRVLWRSGSKSTRRQ